jgi:hypothetical protein
MGNNLFINNSIIDGVNTKIFVLPLGHAAHPINKQKRLFAPDGFCKESSPMPRFCGLTYRHRRPCPRFYNNRQPRPKT